MCARGNGRVRVSEGVSEGVCVYVRGCVRVGVSERGSVCEQGCV